MLITRRKRIDCTAAIFKSHQILSLILLSIINRTLTDGSLSSKDHSFVTARIGSTALIPCNLTIKQVPEDFVTLVLWYKDDMGGAPIFTIDARSRALGSAPRVPNQDLAERASFDLPNMSPHPAFLKITPLLKEDDGLYKCRVDYRRGRTVSTTTYLNVVVPPERIVILNEKRDEVRGSRIGLLPEDSQVKLICRTEGGRPQPSVHWIRDGSVIDDTFTTINDRSLGFVVENELVLSNLSRSDLNSVLSCEAINSNLTSRTSSTVRLELSYAPTCKEGQKLSYGASIGETIAISCDVESSPTPSMFYWIFHSSLFKSSSPSSSPAVMQDVDSFVASTHAAEVISSGSSEAAAMALTLFSSSPYDPLTTSAVSSSALISKQNHSIVSSGSKPITTFSSSNITSHSNKSHLFMPSSSSRTASSSVAGSNTNIRINNGNWGGSSNSLSSTNQNNNNSNRRQEQQPPQQPHNPSSSNSYNKLKYVSDGNRSWLYLTPKSKADFGSVECWATNGLGKQKNACIFTVYPAGPPEPVRECLVHNQSSDSALISCTAGYDGGLKQSFVLEVYECRKEQLMWNLTRDDEPPSFSVKSLSPKTPYAFVIYSYNAKGKSPRTSVNYQINPVHQETTVSNANPAHSSSSSSPSSSSSSSSSRSTLPSSSSSSGDSPNASENQVNESRSEDGASQSASYPSSPVPASEASSLSSLLMKVALLPVLGIVSGLILTLILLAVIFSVLHSIKKQERSGRRRKGSGSAGLAPAGSLEAGTPAKQRTSASSSPTASCDSSAAFNRRGQEIRSLEGHDFLELSLNQREREETKRECHQIISSSSIQDPDLIPLGCKNFAHEILDCESKSTSMESDLIHDHPETLRTGSSLQLIHNSKSGVLLESTRLDSITRHHTPTTDATNMTLISNAMSSFVGMSSNPIDLLHDRLDPRGILILPPPPASSSSGTSSDLLVPRTPYQTTYETSPAGSIGFQRHSDSTAYDGYGELMQTCLMPARSTSDVSFAQDLHQMRLHHLQPEHHQQPLQVKQQQGQSYYYWGEGTKLGMRSSQTLPRGSMGRHLEPSPRDSISSGRGTGQAVVVQTISGSEGRRLVQGCEDGRGVLTGYSTPV